MTFARIDDVVAGFQAAGRDDKLVRKATGKTPFDFGDGAGTAAFQSFIAASAAGYGVIPAGEYDLGQLPLPDGGTIRGAGANATTLKRTVAGNFFNASTQQKVSLSGLNLDLQRSTNGFSGHGISSIASDSRFDDLIVKDFGSDLVSGGGSGLLVVKPISGPKPVRARILNSTFIGDPTAARSYGWILSDVDYSFVSNVFASNIVGYAHELKNDSRFNSMVGLIGADSDWSLAYGQETPGTDGCDMNVAAAIVAAACDCGYLIGEGFGNVLTGMVYRETGSPGRQATKNAVRYEAGAQQNVTLGVVSIGDGVTQTIRHMDSHKNVTQVAAHDGATVLARFDGTSAGNYVEVLHPGGNPATNASISGRIVYGNVTTLRGKDANVVHCPATGQRIGTQSNGFLDQVGVSGAIYSTSQHWRYDSDQYAFHALGVPGNAGDEAGLVVNTASASRQGQLSYAKGATSSDDYWLFRVGAATVLRLYNAVFRPETDNTFDLGLPAFRFRDVYSRRIRPGAGTAIWTSGEGSPEGVLAAPVGSLYTRTDGGAGTTLYAKETGAGTSGWVAK